MNTTTKVCARAIAAMTAAFALVLAASVANAESISSEPVRVAGLTTITASAPFMIADGKGYFKDAGITVVATKIASGQNAIPALASGKVDVVIGGASAGMFNALSAGLGFRYVGDVSRTAGGSTGTQFYVSTRALDSDEVKTISDLKGKKIAIAGGAGATGGYMLAKILEEGGLTLNDVKVLKLPFSDMEVGLKTGAFVGAIPASPFDGKIAEDGVGKPFKPVPRGIAGIGVEYGESFISSRPKAAQAFFDALVRAAGDLQPDKLGNPENAEILAKATGAPVALIKRQLIQSLYPRYLSIGSFVRNAQPVYMKAGLLDYKVPLPMSRVIDETFTKNAEAGK